MLNVKKSDSGEIKHFNFSILSRCSFVITCLISFKTSQEIKDTSWHRHKVFEYVYITILNITCNKRN